MLLSNPSYLNSQPHFKAMFFNMAALAAVSIPLLVQLPVGVVAVFGIFLLIRLVLLSKGITTLKKWQLFILAIGMAALVMQQLGTIIGLEGGASLLLLLSLLKSFEGKTRRDWQVLVVVMMFLLAAGILFEQGLFASLWVMVCLVLMATSLAVLNELRFQAAFRQSVLAFLLSLLPTIVLFVAMPRREMPLWGMPQIKNEQQATTGLSNSMKPGSISNLVQSNEPVFSAIFDNQYQPQQKDLYWRVLLLSGYSGSEWYAARDFADGAVPKNTEQTITYHVMMQDDKGRVPALDYPVDVDKQRGLHREAGNMVRVLSRQGVRRFDLQSALSDELPHQLNKIAQEWYTRLPENTNPRTRALAQQLWQQAGGDAEKFVQTAYLYLKKNQFSYTLNPPLLNSSHKTDEFIFESKLGFCEHYSDAFVILMRSAGLPARVVTGYQGGEYNEEGGFWQIRSKDAHAWVEVWLPQRQVWKRVDPTSAVAANRIEGSIDSALSENEATAFRKYNFVNKYLDRGRFYWQQWIVNYDSDRQQNLFAKLGFEQVTPLLLFVIMVVGVLVGLVPLWLWWWRSRSQEILPLEHGFVLLKRQVLGKDFPQLASVTPLELRDELIQQNRLSEDLNHLINQYIELRYANSHEPPITVSKMWYRRAKKMAKKYKLENQL